MENKIKIRKKKKINRVYCFQFWYISSKLYLSKVLYSSEIKYILALIGWLDNTGFSIIFANRKYIIHDINSFQVAKYYNLSSKS